jgi:hypothetical protein
MRKALIVLFPAWVVVAFIVAQHASYVPAWDAGWYYACLQNAIDAPFKLCHFNCSGHVSFAYIFLLSLVQRLHDGSPAILYAANTVLWCAACFSLQVILRRCSPEKESGDGAAALAAFAVAWSPFFIVSILHLNLDFGVTVFLLPCLAALLSSRLELTVLTGCLMMFTKEIGAALYVVIFFASFLLNEPAKPSAEKVPLVSARLRRGFILSLPILLFAFRTAVRLWRHPDLNLFYTEDGYGARKETWESILFDWNIFDQTFRSYLFDIFIMQGNWILGLAALAGIGVLWRQGRLKSLRHRPLVFLAIVFVAAFYLVTRHRAFNHTRYLLSAIAMYYVLCLVTLQSAFRPARVAYVSAVCSAMFLIGNYASFDPVSRWYFGTVAIGERSVFNTTRNFFIPNSYHQNFLRDELAYNLQFTRMLRAAEEIFARLRLTGHTTFMGSLGSKFFWPEFVDENTFARAGRRSGGVFRAHYFDSVPAFSEVAEKPPRLAFVEFPTMRAPKQYEELKQWYEPDGEEPVSVNGYVVKICWFRLKNARAAPDNPAVFPASSSAIPRVAREIPFESLPVSAQ